MAWKKFNLAAHCAFSIESLAYSGVFKLVSHINTKDPAATTIKTEEVTGGCVPGPKWR